MQFSNLRLATNSPQSLRSFYADTLGLPSTAAATGSFTIDAGSTALTFVSDPEAMATRYHLALNVDADVESVASWVDDNAELLPVDGAQTVRFDFIEANSVYFADPTGNVLEFVCPFGATGVFTPETIESVTEVGLPVEAPPAVATELVETFGIPVWGGVDETFTRLGDVDGRFVISELERPWFPTDYAAVAAPLDVTVQSTRRAEWAHPDLPYRIITSSASSD